MELFKKLWIEEEGQDLIEYGVLLGFITLAVASALIAIRDNLNILYSNTAQALSSALG